jgi:hypothetical protein
MSSTRGFMIWRAPIYDLGLRTKATSNLQGRQEGHDSVLEFLVRYGALESRRNDAYLYLMACKRP